MNTSSLETLLRPGSDEPRTLNFEHQTLNGDPEGELPELFKVQGSRFKVQRLLAAGCLATFLLGAVRGGLSVLLLWVFAFGSTLGAAEPTKAQIDFFENKIRPIFAGNCYKCHSPAEGKIKGGLELDWKGGWEKGGENGPVIVPGAPEQSLLIKAVRYTDPDLQMPPKGEKLSEAQISDLVAWVKMGAPDPRAKRPAAATAGEYGGNGKDHWAFKPMKKPPLPAVRNDSWIRNDVDRFILAKLEANGMTPNEPADQRALIRRVYFDLIGLPPTPDEMDNFVNDDSPKAFEKVVDKLLASPHYGERWGRHWLDVARYSDSKGQFDRRRESSLYPSVLPAPAASGGNPPGH